MKKQTRKRTATKPARKAARRTVNADIPAPATKAYVDRELEIIYQAFQQGFRSLQGRAEGFEDRLIRTGYAKEALHALITVGVSDPNEAAVMAFAFAESMMTVERANNSLTAETSEGEDAAVDDLSDNEPEEVTL